LIHSLQCDCNDVRAVAFSYDGNTLACGGRDGCVALWDTELAVARQTWRAHGRRIRTLAFSQDGSRLATAGEDRLIRVWDISAAERICTLDHNPGKVMSLCFCGPQRLASGGSDNLVRVWNLDAQQVIATHAGHTGSIAALAADREGKLLVSGGFDTTVRLWSLAPTSEAQARRLEGTTK
jgi:WD40 repeat protein